MGSSLYADIKKTKTDSIRTTIIATSDKQSTAMTLSWA